VTIPKKGHGPIAVFDSEENAIEFATRHTLRASDVAAYSNTRIFKCRYIPSKRKYLYWRDDWSLHTAGKGDLLPPGTVIATRVELLSESH